jgi:hypothetical protein
MMAPLPPAPSSTEATVRQSAQPALRLQECSQYATKESCNGSGGGTATGGSPGNGGGTNSEGGILTAGAVHQAGHESAFITLGAVLLFALVFA